MSVQSMGEMGKDFCPDFLQPFLETIDRVSCNRGGRELIPVFHNPHRKFRPPPSAVARTLEYPGEVAVVTLISWLRTGIDRILVKQTLTTSVVV